MKKMTSCMSIVRIYSMNAYGATQQVPVVIVP
jgi:hypothetical protein